VKPATSDLWRPCRLQPNLKKIDEGRREVGTVFQHFNLFLRPHLEKIPAREGQFRVGHKCGLSRMSAFGEGILFRNVVFGPHRDHPLSTAYVHFRTSTAENCQSADGPRFHRSLAAGAALVLLASALLVIWGRCLRKRAIGVR
jgi:hypothetical protein